MKLILQLAAGLVVHACGEAEVLPVENGPDRVGTAEGERGLRVHRQCQEQGREQRRAGHGMNHGVLLGVAGQVESARGAVGGASK